MKKLSIVLLAVLLVASLIISCDNSTKALTDGLVEVRIGTDSGSRGLGAAIDMSEEGIVWHYSATKVTERQFKFGETSDSALSEDVVVTFSQGIWDFGLWALKDGKRVYSGTVTGVLITKTSDGSPTLVVVPVSPYTGVKGTIKLTGITIHAKTDGETPVLVTPNYAEIDNTEIAGFNGTADAIEVATGSHSVTVAYKGTDGVTYASETIYVTVYSGRETLVTGFVDEETGSADIDHKSTVAIVGITGGVKNDTESSVSVAVTPSMGTGVNTKVTFPQGSFTNTEAAAAALTVNVKPIDSTFSASAAGSDTAVAGLDIALMVGNQPVTQFNGKSVTIETFIAKGLTGVQVYYNGVVIGGSTYDSGSGMLTFTTTHFSEFYVGAKSIQAINVDTNTAFETLQGAIDSASAGNTIKLLKEVELGTSSLTINGGKSITIDMNGFNIHAKSKTISIYNANVTFAGVGTIYESDDDQYGALIVSGSDTDASNYTVVTVEKGVTLRGWSGIFIAKDIANTYNNYGVVINLYGNVIVPGMDTHTVAGNGLYINGSNKNTTGNIPVININGAVIQSNGLGIYAAGYAKWNISGDTEITGNYSAIEIRAGELTIDGGSYSATSTNQSVVANGNGSTTTGAAIAVAQHTSDLPINVTINGGSFTGFSALYASDPEAGEVQDVAVIINDGIFTATNTQNPKAIKVTDNVPVTIKGGRFSSDPTEYLGYKDSGLFEILPEGPAKDGDNWTVTPENAQYTLDGAYGSIDGKTIVFSAGTYPRLELGRATKYAGSNTDYYIGGISEGNKKTFDEFCTIKNSGSWSASAYYVRNIENVTLRAERGVIMPSIVASSGHVYGTAYDYVLDKAYTTGSAYYLVQNMQNVTIEGFNFTEKVDFSSSLSETVIDGVTFRECTFTTGGTASSNGQGLRYYNENNNGNVKNLTVDKCKFNSCYQGVYTQKINGVTVMNSIFNTTGHNAIAVQSSNEAVNHKAVVITGNTFTNIGDRIIRFGDVGADTQITIQNNTATKSGDSSKQVIKAQSLAYGITYNISGNNWGEGTNVANSELGDQQTGNN